MSPVARYGATPVSFGSKQRAPAVRAYVVRGQAICVDTFRLDGGARQHDVVRSPNAAFLASGWVCEANFGAKVSITFGGYATD
jgi:hypothetical protein